MSGYRLFANHKLSKIRDQLAREHALEDARNNRKRDFRGFTRAFRSWAERSSLGNMGDEWNNRVHPFREHAARIREDISNHKRVEFDERVTALCRLTPSQVTEYKIEGSNADYIGKHKVCSAIDRVVEMLD